MKNLLNNLSKEVLVELEEQEFIGINNYLYQENPEPEEAESYEPGFQTVVEAGSYTCSSCCVKKEGLPWHVENDISPGEYYCKTCFELGRARAYLY